MARGRKAVKSGHERYRVNSATTSQRYGVTNVSTSHNLHDLHRCERFSVGSNISYSRGNGLIRSLRKGTPHYVEEIFGGNQSSREPGFFAPRSTSLVDDGQSSSSLHTQQRDHCAIFHLLCKLNIPLQAQYLHTSQNVKADFLSRLAPHSEWEISGRLFDQLVLHCGLPDVGSVVKSPGSLGDAMMKDWGGVFNYGNLSSNMLTQVGQKLLKESAFY
jgi:hypothetical protein